MSSGEKKKLLHRESDEAGGGTFDISEFQKPSNKTARSVSVGALGGSASLGTFHFSEDAENVKGIPKAYSVSVDGRFENGLTPTQLGRQNLYELVPFTATFGLQKKERTISEAFATYAADVDIKSQSNLSQSDIESRRSRTSMIILDELEFDTVLVTMPLVFAILLGVLSQFLVGYNSGVVNAPESVIFPGHSTFSWSVAVAAFAGGAPFGATIVGKLADSRGRRGALLMTTWIFLLGGLIQTFALDMFSVIVARIIIGFASGFSSVLVPIYLGELAPPTLRGTIGTLTQFALVSGILVSNLMGLVFATETMWRALFAVTPICCIIQLALAPFLLESPRWLLGRDAASLKARFIIKQLRGLRYDHEVETEVGYFLIGGAAQRTEKTSQQDILGEMLGRKKIRLLLVSAVVLQMAQQFSGINAVFFYSTGFFKGVIDNPMIGTTIVGAVNVVATYAALLLMDRCGRKSLILWSSGGMFVSCVFIVLALLGYFGKMIALIAVNVYVIFFELGLGPVPFLIVAEMFDAKYVATAMSLCMQVNWGCNFIVSLGWPFMNQLLGPYSFVPFAIVLAFAFFYSLFILPETQGTTPEALAADLVRRNSRSIVYEPNSNENPGAIDEEWRKAMEQLMKEEQEEMQTGNFNYGFQPVQAQGNQDEGVKF
mmetsp:Transcript_8005/g.11572  ORF Transcript_8005/g.11572 Transcript_8005/m.11572 type:complete len:659 (+) Transcript_8005:126-2102(+)|eukprot:CAMPEP_0194214612 /NCGR_PEP_ID=MMETSP0156-20130528/15906_1 /TAXON_ID=33649 /ORGANISM="Thalassionema nitzschioides, Strain L26-B" /LENGTH=658 /DNA_ID=CAMNT_0038942909 /DNA_START=66 /DNA_END=2042 /DNA_ORIENTATION=-